MILPIVIQNNGKNENRDLYFNLWSRKNRDNSLKSYHPVMPSRGKKFQLHERYYPGINYLDMPPWFEGIISSDDWKSSLRKFNDTLYSWWRPGDRARNYALFVAWLFLPLLCCISALDETTPRKKTQCINAMKSICEQLTKETPLKWSVDFQELNDNVMISPDLTFIGIELCVSVKYPQNPGKNEEN